MGTPFCHFKMGLATMRDAFEQAELENAEA